MLKRSGTSRRRRVSVDHLVILSLFVSACVGYDAARAAEYPVKPVRLVVPFAPGGSSDSVARMVGAKLTEAWGQQIIVENRPGASTNIGSTFVARSVPDGGRENGRFAAPPCGLSRMAHDALTARGAARPEPARAATRRGSRVSPDTYPGLWRFATDSASENENGGAAEVLLDAWSRSPMSSRRPTDPAHAETEY